MTYDSPVPMKGAASSSIVTFRRPVYRGGFFLASFDMGDRDALFSCRKYKLNGGVGLCSDVMRF